MIINGNSLDVLKTLDENSVESIVTDPPYGLSFMGKAWDYDVPQVELWKEAIRVLKPGGYLLAFAGTRTQHRMAVNIEDAGFEIRDMIAWIYGSGFPKSHNIGKAVARLNGQDIPKEKGFNVAGQGIALNPNKELRSDHPNYIKPKYDNEYEGWGTALKPALEPITVARKPFKGTVAQNILEWGTGGINIDGSRVGTEVLPELTAGQAKIGTFERHNMVTPERTGRFPANLITDGSDEVVGLLGEPARFFYTPKASKSERNKGLEGFEAKEGRPLGISNWDGQTNGSGKVMGKSAPTANTHPTVKPVKLMQYLVKLVTPPQVTDCIDCGTVLQYLYGTTDNKLPMVQTRFSEERKTQENSQVLRKDMRSKMVGTKQKDHKGLDDNKQGLQNADGQRTPQSEQIRLRTGTSASDGKRNRQVSDTTGDSPPQELEQDRQPTREPRSFRQDNTRQATEATNQADRMSSLPSSYKVIGTCKKCNGTLVSRPGICLDPFNGSGTTGIACKLEGFNYIGIELDPEYVKLSEARIEAWTPEPDEEQLELV